MYEATSPKHWKLTSVFDLARWKNGLAYKKINFSHGGKPVIKIAELKAGVTEVTRYTEDDFDKNLLVKSGDMLFSWSGNPDTSIDVYRWDGPDGWLNQHIYKVTAAQGISKEFLFYLLRWMRPRFAEIARNKQTTGLGHVTLQDFRDMHVRIPDSEEQKAIVGIVEPIQKKIDLNRKINITLQEIIRELYRYWFIHFGPTRAKLEGKEPYTKNEIWDMFPEKFDKEGNPKGWRSGKLEEIATTKKEVINPQSIDAETPYIGLKHMPKNSVALGEWGEAREVSSGKLVFDIGDFLFGKLSPNSHKAGQAPVSGICSTDIIVICPKEKEWEGYIIACISGKDFIVNADKTSTGTIMPRTSWKTIARYPIAIPPKRLGKAFNEIVAPQLESIRANIHESRSLKKTLNMLLAKLMSGEIQIKK